MYPWVVVAAAAAEVFVVALPFIIRWVVGKI
jgi:hypothetical protein